MIVGSSVSSIGVGGVQAATSVVDPDVVCAAGAVGVTFGTEGDDDLWGTSGADVICGLGGNDVLRGLDGNDVLVGGRGDDRLDGGNGSDSLYGGVGDDELTDSNGNEIHDGGVGNDRIRDQNGNDTITGGLGNDDIDDSNGVDTIDAGPGDDVVKDSNGNDRISLGHGRNTLLDSNGNDVITAGDGDDTIDDRNGNDTITTGGGNDNVLAGNGNDVVDSGAGDDIVSLGNGRDRADLGSGNDRATGGNDDDILIGGNGPSDDVDGNNGNDSCSAETVSRCEQAVADEAQAGLLAFPETPAPSSFEVDASGVDGVRLVVESAGGLYPWDVSISPGAAPANLAPIVVSPLVDLRQAPNTAPFTSATLTLTYDEALVDEMDESALRVWTFDDNAQLWVPVEGEQLVDVEANTVTASLAHFSYYAVLEMDLGRPEMWRRVIGDTPTQCVSRLGDLGVDVALIVDTSGSMSWNDPSDLRVQASRTFVAAMGPNDRVGVVSFNSVARAEIGLTRLDTEANKFSVNLAINRTGADGGGTNIADALRVATNMLGSSPAGRPRVALLLTDGDGTYSRSYAQAAADKKITVYTVGLGTAVNRTILNEIATVTGGSFIQLAHPDQLVPLYSQLGGVIFDNGDDTDGDLLTDCIETNGAFTPAVVSQPSSVLGYPTAEVRSSYVTLNPNLADTDADNVDDGVELVPADLRDHPLVAQTYKFLIDAGITRYYRQVSDPLNPLDPSNDTGGNDDDFSFGRLRVEDLNLPQSTLFQPERYGPTPAIDRRLLATRTDTGFSLNWVTYQGEPVTYDDDYSCVQNCDEIRTLAEQRAGDGVFGCSIAGDDVECEMREIMIEAVEDQAVFALYFHGIASDFLRNQISFRCGLSIGDLDRCSTAVFDPDYSYAALFGLDIHPDETDLIIESFVQNDSRILFAEYVSEQIRRAGGGFDTIDHGDMEIFLLYRRALLEVVLNFDNLDATTGGDDMLSEHDLYVDGPTGPLTGPLLADSLRFLADHPDLLRLSTARVEFTEIELAVGAVSMEAFLTSPGSEIAMLRAFPLVGPGEQGVSTAAWTGVGLDYTPALVTLIDNALLASDPDDRSMHNELIARLPESNTNALRNDLITAMYIEYGRAVQDWLGDGKGNNWGLVAPWASQGVNAPIRGEFPAIIQSAQQTAADGNQWIFYNIGSRYAAFIEVIEHDRTPSINDWEQFFSENFDDGERHLRDGFVALVAAHYEPDAARAQLLLLQSNLLLATHEQAGVQPHLEQFDQALVPDFVENWFINLQMGADVELNTDTDLGDNFGVDLHGEALPGNLIWDVDLLANDPNFLDSSTIFDTTGFDVNVGGAPTSNAVDVAPLTGVQLTPSWTDWRNDQTIAGGIPVAALPYEGDSRYLGTAADVWWDWEERQWYLLNLFRIGHTDDRINTAPVGRDLDSDPVARFDSAITDLVLEIDGR